MMFTAFVEGFLFVVFLFLILGIPGALFYGVYLLLGQNIILGLGAFILLVASLSGIVGMLDYDATKGD